MLPVEPSTTVPPPDQRRPGLRDLIDAVIDIRRDLGGAVAHLGRLVVLAETLAQANQPPSEWMDVEEAARLLGVDRTTVYDAVSRGDIPALRLGRTIRISRRALEELGHGVPDQQRPADTQDPVGRTGGRRSATSNRAALEAAAARLRGEPA